MRTELTLLSSTNVGISTRPSFLSKSRKVMATAEPENDPRIPSAASSWNQNTLMYLNAEYKKDTCTTFEFDEGRIMSSELSEGVSRMFLLG